MSDERHLMAELRANLDGGDLLKARLVLRSLAGQRQELQREALAVLCQQPPAVALPLFGALLDLRIGDLGIARAEIAAQAARALLDNDLQPRELSDDAMIHLATALGNSADARAPRPLRRLLTAGATSANLRFTVYEALSRLPVSGGGYMLAAGLEDPEASVRIAAARAVEKNLDATLAAGLRNLLQRPPPLPDHIVGAVCQAGAMNTLEALLDDERFANSLAHYLEQAPDRELMTQLLPLLARSRRRDLAALVATALEADDIAERPLIYAVDDSTMILRMYRAALANVHCTLRVFDNPFEALEWVSREAPDLLFTDLNMPGLDGIELTSTLRSGSQAEDFPIIMVTTQSEGADTARARHSGVDQVIEKPFRGEDLVAAINELTDYSV